MQELRQQACHFDDHFLIESGPQASVAFRQPVLLARDIDWLLGLEGASSDQVQDELKRNYRLQKLTIPENQGELYEIDLEFVRSENQFLLSKVNLPPEVSLLMQPDMIRSSAARLCEARWSLARRSAMQELDPEMVKELPTREELMTLLGPPSSTQDNGEGLVYEYRIESMERAAPTARAVIWYGADGQRPLRMRSNYRFMQVEMNFEQMVAVFNFKA